MLTTRRSMDGSNQSYSGERGGNVGLLEKEETKVFSKYEVEVPSQAENDVEAKTRMQKNLDLLLNYDKIKTADEVKATATDAPYKEAEKEEVFVKETAEAAQEDIRPSSTTMQFGGDDVETMYQEMNKEEEKSSYRLNGKGKLVVVLYSLVVAVILALIIINTGVLASINATNEVKREELSAAVNNYNAAVREVDEISNNEYVINMAENEYNMVYYGD